MSYQPECTLTGPAYSRPFQRVATVIMLVLVVYGLSVAARFPLLQYSIGVLWLLGGLSLLLVASWWFFLHSTVTIDQTGLRQTWIFDKKVEWRDVRSARLLGLPLLHRLLPPRLMLRTSTGFFVTFQAGTPELLAEYARIAMAFDVTRQG